MGGWVHLSMSAYLQDLETCTSLTQNIKTPKSGSFLSHMLSTSGPAPVPRNLSPLLLNLRSIRVCLVMRQRDQTSSLEES